jgi:hypothetical protein
MPDRASKETDIAALPDPKWAGLMGVFQQSREALIRQNEQFKAAHDKHYDELLDMILKLGRH